MGMSGCFAAVDASTLERLRASPDQLEDFLYPDDGDSEPENSVCVDKAWHGIHYLLAGDVDHVDAPAGWAVMGGREIGEDMGYGPARWLDPDQVRRVAEALPDVDEFSVRFDPEAMTRNGVYPDVIWLRDADSLDYLVENYEPLLTFYRDAAARGDGVFLWLC